MQGTKEIKGLESILAVWDNLMLNFKCPPEPAHMYTAFLSKIRNIPELQERDFLKKMSRQGGIQGFSSIGEFCAQLGSAQRLRGAAVSFQLTTASSEQGLAPNPAPRGRKHKPP